MTLARSLVLGSLAALLSLAPGLGRAGDAVKTASKEGVGAFLVDSKGMTLYTFKKDSPGKSACSGECLAKWPAFHAYDLKPGGNLKAGDFSEITRDDGAKQTAYKGLPLYYFVADKAAGDTAGQGMKGVWMAATP
jgi:predicted lipoprotein with Yx(FWY)xxD motif